MSITFKFQSKTLLFGLMLASSAIALDAQGRAVTVPVGTDLRVVLSQGSRIHKVGFPVLATLRSPIYVGEILVAPVGTQVEGHVTGIVSGRRSVRVSRILRGDFTPPHVAEIAMDRLVLADGTRLVVQTLSSQGIEGIHEVHFVPKGQKPGLKSQVAEAFGPYRDAHKWQRFGQAALMALPVHPNYLTQGTIYDAVLEEELTFVSPAEVIGIDLNTTNPSNLLRVKLVTPLNSRNSASFATVSAEVTEPFYTSDHRLLYPVGSILVGKVGQSKAASWLHRNGALGFEFTSITIPGRSSMSLSTTVNGLDVSGDQNIVVSSEGALRATTSRFAQGAALAGFVQPALASADSTFNKTAFDRGGLGQGGFGLVGAAAAQATASTALGFGYYGAAKGLYGAFIAKGTDITIPANTPISLIVDLPGAGSAEAVAAIR